MGRAGQETFELGDDYVSINGGEHHNGERKRGAGVSQRGKQNTCEVPVWISLASSANNSNLDTSSCTKPHRISHSVSNLLT